MARGLAIVEGVGGQPFLAVLVASPNELVFEAGRGLSTGGCSLPKPVQRVSSGTEDLIRSDTYALGRAEIDQIMNVYAIKMAGVFTISTSTISPPARIAPALDVLPRLRVGAVPFAECRSS